MRFLCATCWSLSAPYDPSVRCRHCFAELEEREELCSVCLHEPAIPIPTAFVFDRKAPIWRLREEDPASMAAFAMCQWDRLHWPFPDSVIPFPDGESLEMARSFSQFLTCSCPDILRQGDKTLYIKEGKIEPNATLFLFGMRLHREEIQNAIRALAQTFPKRMYALSLFEG